MTSVAIRKKIHQYIDSADEKVIKALYIMVQELDKASSSIEKFSLEEYNESIDKAEKEAAKGKVISHKDALKQIIKW